MVELVRSGRTPKELSREFESTAQSIANWAAGLVGASRRRSATTTRRDPCHQPPNELVRRNFYVESPNELAVADFTFVPTLAGFLRATSPRPGWERLGPSGPPTSGRAVHSLAAKTNDEGCRRRVRSAPMS